MDWNTRPGPPGMADRLPVLAITEGAMFCSECGVAAEGKFCWSCGAPLHGAPAAPATRPEPPPREWADEVRYDVLIAHPVVRDLIARHGAGARAPISGETLLALFDKLKLSPIPLETIGQISVPLWTSLGVKSGTRTRTETIAQPCGRVIVAALCSLARNSQPVTRVDQAEDGCTLRGAMPSDFRSIRGEVAITLRRRAGATHVDAGAWSTGQLFDWGKSRACLDRLFDDLRRLPDAG